MFNPFWQESITDKLLRGIVTPTDVIADYILATEQERAIIEFNLKSSGLPSYHKFLGPYKLEDIPVEYHQNFFNTVDMWNRIEDDYGYELLCTNLFRSMSHHKRIYKRKGIKEIDIPMKSKHLYCQAADCVPVKQTVQHFQKWFTQQKMEQHNAWVEKFKHTPTWVHGQIVPYGSWRVGKPRDFGI